LTLASGDGKPLTAKKGPFVEDVHIGPQGAGVQEAAEAESRFKYWTQVMSCIRPLPSDAPLEYGI